MDIRQLIDFTLLKPDCVYEDIDRLVDQVLEKGYYSVCVPPFFVEYIRRKVEDEAFKISTVVGFPNGFDSYKSKVEEIKEAISDGALEIDAVLNISAVKTKSWSHVDREIDSLASICRVKNAKLKLITDHNLLTQDELKKIVEYCATHSVNFIKTGTGMYGDTTPEVVAFFKSICPPELKIKAAGGINTLEKAQAMVEKGADRIGTSSIL